MKKKDPFFIWNNCNICRQCILKEKTEFKYETDWDKLCTIEYLGQIFLMKLKKVWQVYTMNYKVKSYVTTVYKCDDKKKDHFFVWNNCNICRQCILKEKTEFHCETDWDVLSTIDYMGQMFSNEA